jgi:PTH1 family peptidyl-tRNA hydrolase
MKIITGLGNPGREYAATRHNVGWWVVDHLADVWHFDGWRKDGVSVIADGTVGGTRVRLMKPQTYMNLSGDALKPYLRRPFWSAKVDLLVVVDEVALPLGRYRLRANGSAGGHNGLKHIEHTLRSRDYARLRIGVGPNDEHRQLPDDLAEYVLAPFGKREREDIIELMPQFTTVCETWIREGAEKAMNLHNRRASNP